MRKIRFGIVGAGAIAQLAHIPAIKRVPEAELTAVCRRTRSKAEALAREVGAKEVYENYRELVKSENIDAVIVATPNAYHKEPTVLAAEEGKHVLCEKPLAHSLRDAKEMVRACHRAGVKLMTAFNFRFSNQVEIAKKLIDEGTIGKVHGFRSVFRGGLTGIEELAYRPETDYREHIELSGGGCVIDCAIHHIDLVRMFFGEFREVCARVTRSVSSRIDDNAEIVCSIESGAIGSISSDYYSPSYADAIDLYGVDGIIYISTLTLNPFQSVPLAIYTKKYIGKSAEEIPEIVKKYTYPKIFAHHLFKGTKPENDWVSIIPPRDINYDKQIKAFCECVSKDKEPPTTGEDGVKALEIVLAIYKSSEQKKWIKLPLGEQSG